MKIPLADWKCSTKERKYINAVLDSGWLTYGAYCKCLERLWSIYHHCRYGVINNSGTSSLQLAWRALKEANNWPDDTEILVPAITFPATINAITESRLIPVLVDVELDGMIDIGSAAKKITKKTKGICIVHLWGTPYPRKINLIALCKQHSLKIVEDSCETISRKVGFWGEISCFSMYFNHIISAGVGGMVCTNNRELEKIMRSLANHGMINVHVLPKYKRFNFCRTGYSMRVTELEAALGCAQFEQVDKTLAKRTEISKCLTQEFEKRHIQHAAILISGIMMYPLIFTDVSGTNLHRCMAYLDKVGIETREMLPITNQLAFKSLVKNYGDFPGAQWINNSGMFFPIHPLMSKGDCEYIAESLHTWLCKSGFKNSGT